MHFIFSPSIDIDANNIGFRKNKYLDEVDMNISIAEALRKKGAKVCIIADNKTRRHSSKRASSIRAAKREKNRLKEIELSIKLNDLRQNNSREAETLAKELAASQRASQRCLKSNFSDELKRAVEDLHDESVHF